MKKKMMAIVMATLMLGTLFAVPAMAEDTSTFSYYEPFNADFVGTAVTVLTSVPDPTTPEGETPTNYCLPVKANASNGGERQQPCVTLERINENDRRIAFESGMYKLSYRAYSETAQYTTIALFTTGTVNSTKYPYRYFMNYKTGPQTKAGEWAEFSIVFHLPETLEKDGDALPVTTLMINFDNAQAAAPIYYDDLKIEQMKDTFFYVKDTAYASYAPTASSKDNLYYQGETAQGDVLSISRGTEVKALTGAAEKIRPVLMGRSTDLGEAVTVIHAVYETKGGKKSLHTVEVCEVTKNLRNMLIAEDKEIDIPAKTAEASYELKSFVWDSASGLNSLGAASSLSVAETE